MTAALNSVLLELERSNVFKEDHLPSWQGGVCAAAGAASAGVILLFGGRFAMSRSGEGPSECDALVHKGKSCQPESSSTPGGLQGAAAACTVIAMAIPSIIGSCCWPLLLVTAFGAGSNMASNDNREASHHFTFGADLVFFAALCIYITFETVRQRVQYYNCITKWGPLLLVVAGCLLTLLDVTRHILLDHGGVFFKEETLAMYADYPKLSFAGRFCQIATVVGLSAMAFGTLWFLQVPEKIKETYLQHYG